MRTRAAARRMTANINCITNCCEPPDDPPIDTCACPECVEVEGNAEGPEQFSVTISGMTDNGCDGCINFNGTYILDCNEPTDCQWRVTIEPGHSSVFCINDLIEVTLTMSAGVATVTCRAEPPADPPRIIFRFSKNFGGEIDCFNLTDESLTPTGSIAIDCDQSSATCLLSSA